MRVLHVLNAVGGGASIGAWELMRTSQQRHSDIEHFVVYPGLRPAPISDVSAFCADCRPVPMRWWNRKESLSPVRRVVVWAREMQCTNFGRKTRRALRQLVRDWHIDLIHTNTAATLDGAIVARQLGIPHVWHIRERIGHNGFMRFRLNDHDLVQRISSLSTMIVPMSRYVGEIFCRHGAMSKTRVVYDGVDLSQFDSRSASEAGRQLRRSWGVSANAILVGKVAAITSTVKRHDIFIRAAGLLARRFPEMRFAIIGTIPRRTSWTRRQNVQYFQDLCQLVRHEGLQGRIVWTDHVDDNGAAMNAIDVLAHACDMEGFGRVAIEAMAAGKPVVGPATGGFGESVVDGQTGILVTPRNHATLAHGIEQLVRSPEKRHAYGLAGRERAAHCFSPAQHLDAMSAVYQSALHENAVVNTERCVHNSLCSQRRTVIVSK